MFERFTDRARRVVVLAQEEARLLGHGAIGTEHLLLALLHDDGGPARQALDALGVSLEPVRAEVRRTIPPGPGPGPPAGHMPFTPRAKKVLELSLREALKLGHNHIGTEHILLGVVREGGGAARQLLERQGVDPQRVYDEVFRMMTVTPGAAPFSRRGSRGRHTAAGGRVEGRARAIAAGGVVGSQHLLLAMLAEPDSLAFTVLTSFGLTPEAVAAKVEELGTAGTGDEVPEQAAGRRIEMRVVGGRLEVTVDDPELVQGLGEVVVTGADPAGAAFPALWQALRSTTGDVRRRLEGAPEEGGTAPGEPSDL